jgi:hypothetical protein
MSALQADELGLAQELFADQIAAAAAAGLKVHSTLLLAWYTSRAFRLDCP